MEIYKFNSIFKPVLWGGDRLVKFLGQPPMAEPIGEVWVLSGIPGHESVVAEGGEQGLTLTQLVQRHGADLVGADVYRRYGDKFPLLIKLIDAQRDLSIQVHPDDQMARRRHDSSGKNEMWYILEGDEGAVIRTGFNRNLTVQEFDDLLTGGKILDVINAVPARPGQVFYIPAGQIHCIGAGNVLVEIQQSSDITYRVCDYNRRDAEGNLRQLHIDEAREALCFNAADGRVTEFTQKGDGVTGLVQCQNFVVDRIDVDGCCHLALRGPHSFVALVCIDGNAAVHADGLAPTSIQRGETALIPASAGGIKFTGTAQLLAATVPSTR